METVPPINTAQVTHCSGDVVILRLEIDDLWTFPQCSTDLVYNFKMAEQGIYYIHSEKRLVIILWYLCTCGLWINTSLWSPECRTYLPKHRKERRIAFSYAN